METILIKNSGDDMKRNIGPVMRTGKSPVPVSYTHLTLPTN